MVKVRTQGKGTMMVRPEDVQGLGPEQIQQKFGLEAPPVEVANVEIPAGTKIREGEVQLSQGGNYSPAIQFEMLE